MEPIGKDFIELLVKAEHSIRIADHMVYITYPLIKEHQLLKKVLDELCTISMNIVQAILSYEYLNKRIQIHQDPKLNWDSFRQKSSVRFGLTNQEYEIIKELLELAKKHKESSMEFIRNEKIVIMSNNLRTDSVSVDQLKKYLSNLKVILQKTKAKMVEDRASMMRK